MGAGRGRGGSTGTVDSLTGAGQRPGEGLESSVRAGLAAPTYLVHRVVYLVLQDGLSGAGREGRWHTRRVRGQARLGVPSERGRRPSYLVDRLLTVFVLLGLLLLLLALLHVEDEREEVTQVDDEGLRLAGRRRKV